jgi:DNA-binding MarR family transcriptional regulator/GNAT superfamily N-acetyltransferase
MKLVDDIRQFNRFYTRQIGLLAEHLPASELSLAEARVLYEIANRKDLTGAELTRLLDMDKAHVSRILTRFRSRGLIALRSSPTHAKHRLITLSKRGMATFATMNRGTHDTITDLVKPLSGDARERLRVAMRAIMSILAGASGEAKLRTPKPGDLGWVTHRQAVIYHEEHGWDWTYEALVARIFADFIKGFDAKREDAWIADIDGEIAGSIFLMKTDRSAVAKLRLLYVEAWARGQGLGARLVDTCINRARQLGYRTLELWTNDVLTSARRIYEAKGFTLKASERHRSFGKTLTGQTWSLTL